MRSSGIMKFKGVSFSMLTKKHASTPFRNVEDAVAAMNGWEQFDSRLTEAEKMILATEWFEKHYTEPHEPKPGL